MPADPGTGLGWVLRDHPLPGQVGKRGIDVTHLHDEVVDGTRVRHGTFGVVDELEADERVIGQLQRSFTSEVVHLDPPTTWSVRGIDGPVRAAIEVEVAAPSEQRSRLTISITFEGRGIGKLVVPLAIDPGVPREMARDLASLKERLEVGAS